MDYRPAIFFLAFAVLAQSSNTTGIHGLDISEYVTIDQFKCLHENGYEFVIVRGYEALGEYVCNVSWGEFHCHRDE